jgi:hypothetical protein
MDTPEGTFVKVGKYTFKIIENKSEYDGKIFSRTFKIGGDYEDCVNLSYMYRDGIPVSAKLPHLMYEPECAVGSELERGLGSELLIKTLLNYVHDKIKDIHLFQFDDMSHIDCSEKDLTKSPPRKLIRPLKLSYFSIVYNNMTWYEKHFNAKMIDKEKYSKYRDKLLFLNDECQKETFDRFLEISMPPTTQIPRLKEYYCIAKTYTQFFKNIPRKDRCELLLPWLHNFMLHYLKDVYTDIGWEIDINDMEKQHGGKRKHPKRHTRKLYPSNYKLINHLDVHSF